MKESIDLKINHEVNSSSAAEDYLRKCVFEKGRIDQFEAINISTDDADATSVKLSLVRLERKMDNSFSQLNDKLDIIQAVIERNFRGPGRESPTLKASQDEKRISTVTGVVTSDEGIIEPILNKDIDHDKPEYSN